PRGGGEVGDPALELLRLLAVRLLPRIDLRELREGTRRFADAVGRRVLALGERRQGRLAGTADPGGMEKAVTLRREILVLFLIEAPRVDLADLEVERLEPLGAAPPGLLELLPA